MGFHHSALSPDPDPLKTHAQDDCDSYCDRYEREDSSQSVWGSRCRTANLPQVQQPTSWTVLIARISRTCYTKQFTGASK